VSDNLWWSFLFPLRAAYPCSGKWIWVKRACQKMRSLTFTWLEQLKLSFVSIED
jgi:hypothetical protein